MKAKLIIAAAVIAASLSSCSSFKYHYAETRIADAGTDVFVIPPTVKVQVNPVSFSDSWVFEGKELKALVGNGATPDALRERLRIASTNKTLQKHEGDILVAADELRKFSNEFIAAGGKVAPILLPLYNQQIGAKMPMDIAEGLSLHKVKVVDGVETFFVNIDEDKVKFTELRDNIVNVARKIEKAGEAGASKADIEEKVKLSKMNLSLLLPILQELNYGAMWRFATKSGSETYLEITNDEIKTYLAPAEEEPAEDKAA